MTMRQAGGLARTQRESSRGLGYLAYMHNGTNVTTNHTPSHHYQPIDIDE